MKVKLSLVPFLIVLSLVGTVFAAAFTGLYLAFSASILVGLVVLLVEPLPLVFGLAY